MPIPNGNKGKLKRIQIGRSKEKKSWPWEDNIKNI